MPLCWGRSTGPTSYQNTKGLPWKDRDGLPLSEMRPNDQTQGCAKVKPPNPNRLPFRDRQEFICTSQNVQGVRGTVHLCWPMASPQQAAPHRRHAVIGALSAVRYVQVPPGPPALGTCWLQLPRAQAPGRCGRCTEHEFKPQEAHLWPGVGHALSHLNHRAYLFWLLPRTTPPPSPGAWQQRCVLGGWAWRKLSPLERGHKDQQGFCIQ